MPIYQAWPYLIVGEGPWDTKRDTFPRPAGEKYGRAGAPGAPWWVGIESCGPLLAAMVTAVSARLETRQQAATDLPRAWGKARRKKSTTEAREEKMHLPSLNPL